MANVDLTSSRAKLRWAREHRNDLEKRIDATLGNPQNWAFLGAELNSESGEHVFRINAVPDYSLFVEEVSLGVGDVVHSLRGALDHLAWQLANANGPMGETDARSIQFPICEDVAKFGRHRTVNFYDSRDWAQIEQYQPFNVRPGAWSGPYIHELDHLQKLSNADKHRQLSIVLLSSTRIKTIPVEGGRPPWLVETEGRWEMDVSKINEPNPHAAPPNFDHTSYVVEVGAEVVRYRMTSEFATQSSIGTAGAVMPSVALEERRPIMPVLDRIAGFLQLILDEFEDRLRNEGRLAAT